MDSVVILSVVILSVIMLNVIVLSVIMLNVAAPTPRLIFDWNKKYFFSQFFQVFSHFFKTGTGAIKLLRS
jgi:hypothetical protein